jgi:DNA-binding phage protein
MTKVAGKKARYNTSRLQADIERAGLLPIDVARKAGVSRMSAYRAIRGEVTPRMMAKLAAVVGHSLARYLPSARA